MSGTYNDADTLADARNALGFQVPIEQIAGQLRVTVPELQNALGLPQWREPAQQDRQRELPFDLFATERLDGVL